jgi:hypothetical protein
MIRSLFTAAALLVPAVSASADMPEGCALHGQSQFVSVLVCEGQFEEPALVAAGRAACGDRLPCGAWIWASAAEAPAEAPANHDGLTPDQVSAARGVWVAEDEMFIAIEKVAP